MHCNDAYYNILKTNPCWLGKSFVLLDFLKRFIGIDSPIFKCFCWSGYLMPSVHTTTGVAICSSHAHSLLPKANFSIFLMAGFDYLTSYSVMNKPLGRAGYIHRSDGIVIMRPQVRAFHCPHSPFIKTLNKPHSYISIAPA